MESILNEECDDISSIQEINDQYDYKDEYPNGEGDSELVACGQDDDGYNELEYIYKAKLKKYVDEGRITEEEALKALCKACRDLDNPRKREDFYSKLEIILSLNIK